MHLLASGSIKDEVIMWIYNSDYHVDGHMPGLHSTCSRDLYIGLSNEEAGAIFDKRFQGTNRVGTLAWCSCRKRHIPDVWSIDSILRAETNQVYTKRHPNSDTLISPEYYNWAPSMEVSGIPHIHWYLLRCDIALVGKLRVAELWENKASRAGKPWRPPWPEHVDGFPYTGCPSNKNAMNEKTVRFRALLRRLCCLNEWARALSECLKHPMTVSQYAMIYCRIHAFLSKVCKGEDCFEGGVHRLCILAEWAENKVHLIEPHMSHIIFLTEVLMNTSIRCSTTEIANIRIVIQAHPTEDMEQSPNLPAGFTI